MTQLAIEPNFDTAHRPRQRFHLPGRRGIFALGDQAVLSLGNFLTNLALLRAMDKETYGNYGTVLTFLLFLNNLHMAVVTYPLSITAGAGDEDELRRRTRRAVGLTLALLVPCSLALAWPTARVAGWGILPAVVAALALWQVQETLRKAMLSRLRHDQAVPGDFVSYLGQAAVIWALTSRGVSLQEVFWVVAGTSGVAIVVQSWQLKWFRPTPPRGTFLLQARQHWTVGKWMLSTNVAGLLTVYSIPWTIRYYRGSGEAAMLYAVLALLNAGNPVLSSIAGLITPAVANLGGDNATARRATVRYAVGGAALLVPFFLLLAVVPHWVLSHAYKPTSPYVALGFPMRLFSASYALTYASAMVASYLCGIGQSRLPLCGQLANAVVTLGLTLQLAAHYGVAGAAVGSLVAVSLQLAVNVLMLRRRTSK